MEAPACLDEAARLHHQSAGLHVPSDQMTPTEHEAAAGNGCVQRLGVALDDFVPGVRGRTPRGLEPALPGRSALVRPCEIEKGQPLPARRRSIQNLRMSGGVAGRAEGANGSPGNRHAVLGAAVSASQVSIRSAAVSDGAGAAAFVWARMRIRT